MRRSFGHNVAIVRRLVFALAVVAAVLVVPLAQAGSSITVVVTSYTTVQQTHDTPPRGKVNKGDRIDFKDLLVATTTQLGKAKGKPVGYDAGTVLYTGGKTQTISGVTTFPGLGTVTFAGPMTEAKDGTVTVPITGGTGQFKGAKGTLTIGAGDQKAPNTYRLRLRRALVLPGSGPVA
jgi:hypothetical protein